MTKEKGTLYPQADKGPDYDNFYSINSKPKDGIIRKTKRKHKQKLLTSYGYKDPIKQKGGFKL